MNIGCLLLFLFLITVSILVMCYYPCVSGGGRKKKQSYSRSRRLSGAAPLYQRMIELGLDDAKSKELTKDIVGVLSEYSDNPMIVAIKMETVVKNLNEDSLADIQKDKEQIKVLAGLEEGIQELRVQKDEELQACSLYECPRCRARKHTYREVQQRAIDEPTNVKCTCLQCGFRWDQS